jgi:hypothetical protein
MSSERLHAPVFEPGDLVKRRAVDGTVWVKPRCDLELFFAVNMPTTPGIVLSVEDPKWGSSFIKYIILIDGDRFIVHEENLELAT